jgi:ABC-type sugar transport system ATPase subunit
MVYVTHDQEEALTLGDRVVLLDRGEVQQVDRPQALYDRPVNRAAAAFIGWPPMNFLEGQLVQEGSRLFLTRGGWALPLADRQEEWQAFVGRDVVLGIRPEHVRVTAAETGDACRAEGANTLIRRDAIADGCQDQGANAPRSPGLAEIRLVEKAGPFRLATLRYGDWTVTARHEGPDSASEGTLAAVEFGLVQAHLFDPETGSVLSSGRSEGWRR